MRRLDEEVPPGVAPFANEEGARENDTAAADAAAAAPKPETSEPLIQFMTGIREDIAARAPLYRDDWSKPKSAFTVINATVFAFVIQLIPALIFAELMGRETKGNLATAEVLLSSAVIGIIYAIFAGQPMVIMGITGPVAILLGTSYTLTETFDADYFPFFFWVCLWAGLMHMLSAMIGLVSLVWKVTPFTSQIFELFIAVSFIYASLRDLIEPVYLGEGGDRPDRAAQYATLLLGILTYYVSWTLHFAETWTYFTRQIRTVLTSYNTLIAVVVVTALSYLPGVDQGNSLDRVNIEFSPWDWKPTVDRPWIASPLAGISTAGIFGALVPGFMFFLLFIIDHNVSSILSQAPKFNLKKPPAYHLDFFVLGVTFLPCAILGLPPGNGLIPQAPLHVRALCTREHVKDEHGVMRERVTHVEEQRWSGLGQAILMFVALSMFTVIRWIPRGVLFGLLLYLGVGALHGNEIWERICFCFMIEKKRPKIPVVTEVKWSTTVAWTFVQLLCALAVFVVANFTNVGYIYPALLTALVPVRSFILSRLFCAEDVKYLDPMGGNEEDYHHEQIEVHLARHAASLDEEELNFPNRAEFRGQGEKGLHHSHVSSSTGTPVPDDVSA
mmetsp:Transcript_8400/g.17826  ORF Transcript_8400/g.17826 Transcript_8400/m.17826 type:complete len:614 (-) Transcript_8400:92-1933(-)